MRWPWFGPGSASRGSDRAYALRVVDLHRLKGSVHMTDPDTPPTPERPDSGLSSAPSDPGPQPSQTPAHPGPDAADAPVGSPSGVAPPTAPGAPTASGGAAPGKSGRGGCMTTMVGLFAVLAA